MAVAEYDRKLEEHRRKMALGQELLTIIEAGTTIQVRFDLIISDITK